MDYNIQYMISFSIIYGNIHRNYFFIYVEAIWQMFAVRTFLIEVNDSSL